jgi:methylated-DNA-protein-cysteine methyltransferase-like protein
VTPAPKSDPEAFREQVEAVIASLGAGEVVSYGEVAADAGYPGAARAVGRILAKPASHDRELPWWRVVTSNGRLVPGHETLHARLLRAEGVQVRDGRVVRRTRPGESGRTGGTRLTGSG